MPYNPKLLKGALVTQAPKGGPSQTIAFQYNPETLRRTLQPQMIGGQQGDRSLMVRFAGAPVETFTLEVALDAVDSSGVADVTHASAGVLPQLSALELLTYPASADVISAASHLWWGMLEIAPAPAPLTLFVWGSRRVVPVQVASVDVTEQLFDAALTPIRATVALTLRALSYSDLAPGTPGYAQYVTYQQTKESLAQQGRTTGGSAITGVNL
jgi:Contractile injection system tube protein